MTHHRSTYVTSQLPQSALSVLYRTVLGRVKFSIAVLVLTFLPFLSACTEDDPAGSNPANMHTGSGTLCIFLAFCLAISLFIRTFAGVNQ